MYDAHGRRVKQVLDGETIYTVYGIEGALYLRENATTGESTDYVRMGDFVVGRVDETDTFERIFADRLGGPVIGATRQSSVLWRESYTPFGELLDDPPANRDEAGFTGHVRDHATGLTYAQARYYNPVIGRFLSHDPVGFADMGPGYFNRYAYTMNDPVNYFDPTGEDAWLVSRPVGGGLNHMFVVVADGVGEQPRARFSYGPSRRRDGNLVSHSASANQDTGTNRDDVNAWAALGADDGQGVSAVRIDASDAEVIASGEAVDLALGTIENPGDTDYDMIPHGRNDGANSNSAAYQVANTASVIAGNGPQALPPGTRNPGWNQNDRVPVDEERLNE